MDTMDIESSLDMPPPHSQGPAVQKLKEADIIIAVMGVTGAGKSTLICKIIGQDPDAQIPIIGHGLRSGLTERESEETKLTDVYEFHHEQYGTIHLIDTPGFDDTYSTDAEVLREIATFLSCTYETKVKLTGIIYLHRISDNRIAGSALRNLRMFKELCGEDAYRHVVLATSMWGKEDEAVAVGRERELTGDGGFWRAMQARGSAVRRWLGDAGSADAIVQHLMRARAAHGAVALKIQREMVDEGKTLVSTSAGQEVDRELAELRDKLDGELRRIQEENKAAMAEKDMEWHQSLNEQRLLLEKQRQRAEQGQEALKVDFQRLLAETDAKYRQEMERVREELRKTEEEKRNAHEISQQKEQEVEALRARIPSAQTLQEEQEVHRRLKQRIAEMEAARENEARLQKEIDEKEARQSTIKLWFKRMGRALLPIVGTLASIAVSGSLGGSF